MMRARFTENATGIEVVAQTLYQWGEEGPRLVLVVFPEVWPGIPGMEYGLERQTFDRHFSMCPNQAIEARAFGGTPQTRPLDTQKELDDAALLEWARGIKKG
jgi:hypothetical protein